MKIFSLLSFAASRSVNFSQNLNETLSLVRKILSYQPRIFETFLSHIFIVTEVAPELYSNNAAGSFEIGRSQQAQRLSL